MRHRPKLWIICIAALAAAALVWNLSRQPARTPPPAGRSAQATQGAEPAKSRDEATAAEGPQAVEEAPCPEGEVIELRPGILPPGELHVVTVERKTPQAYLELAGEVEYNRDRMCRISPPVSGKVVEILRRQGELVNEGDVLQILDSAEMGRAKTNYLIARHEYALAEAECARQKLLYKSKEQIRSYLEVKTTAEEALRLMRNVPLGDRKSQILTAVSGVEYAQQEWDRAKQLFEKKIGARKDLIHAEKELTEARIRLAAIIEDTSIEARQILLSAEMAERMKRAALDRAKEELMLLGLAAEHIGEIEHEPAERKSVVPITAPFSGTLVKQYVGLGEIVDTSTYLYKLADLSIVWVRADAYEKDLRFVRPHKEVALTVPAYPGLGFEGTIVQVSDELDKEKRTVAARIEIDNAAGELKPGMFCMVKIDIGAREGAAMPLVVPQTAVQDIDGTKAVFVPCGENRFVAVPVVTGEEGDGVVTIISGLREGDQVVTEGSFILKSDLMKGAFREGYED